MATELKIQIPAPNIKLINVNIVGTAPLLYHAWDEKAIKMIEDKQQKKATKGREVRNPEAEYKSSFYYDANGDIAIPARNIKQAIVGSARFLQDVKMTILRGAIFVRGDKDGRIPVFIGGKLGHPTKLVLREDFSETDQQLYVSQIAGYDKKNKSIHMRKDMVTVGMGAADIRYRGELQDWSMEFIIEYDGDLMSAEQVLNLLQRAGFSQGLGEWRPEKNGDNGTFEVKFTSESALLK